MMIDYQTEADTFLRDTRTTFQAEHVGYGPYFPDDKESRNIYRIVLKRMGRSYTFRFGQSIKRTLTETVPTPYDVLACLQKNDPGTFEDFCSDFGYDTDSRKAERMYKAVVKEWNGVKRLFGDVLERLQEIE